MNPPVFRRRFEEHRLAVDWRGVFWPDHPHNIKPLPDEVYEKAYAEMAAIRERELRLLEFPFLAKINWHYGV